jgi:phenylpropionate dioxygenase-like ring-hydroxylating dioxygenase large terminal subunit
MAAAATNGDHNGPRWHDAYPELGTGPVAIEPYISHEFFELERERVFRRTWLNVGRVEQLPNPGDFIVKDIEICHASVIIVRDRDGKIRALHNVCSHRANKVVWESQGSCGAFKCRFHAWSYRLDGKLSSVPDESNFFNLDKEQLGLTPVAVDIWEGFIFINLSAQPAQTLAEYLGEWGEQLRGYPFAENGAVCYEWRTELRCNWKLIKDAFKEAYHVAFLHKRSLRDAYTGGRNPFSHALDFKLFPIHHRWSLGGNPEYQFKPVESVANRFGSFIIISDAKDRPQPAGVNPTRAPNWVLDINGIFPNYILDVAESGYFTYHIWPLAVDRSVWEVRAYFPKPSNAGERFAQEFNRIIFRDTIMEDGSTLEQTQTVLASGAKTHFMFQDEELLLRHDNKVLQDFVNRP